MTKKILICDDSIEFAYGFKRDLESMDVVNENFVVDTLVDGELIQASSALEERLIQASKGKISEYPNDGATVLDETDILVIDYELIDVSASVTGERIAYLARCFSQCGLIIALNQHPPYRQEYFDLTLRGYPESFADLNISSDSLRNPGLWSQDWDNFRPWSWPLLPLALEKFNRRVEDVYGHLENKILEYFSFDEERLLAIPRTTLEFIAHSASSALNTTFKQFVVFSGNGLRGRNDNPINSESIARIAAARIGCWLEHAVLSGQDILVDAPHLIARFPSLIKDDIDNIGSWNHIAKSFEKEDLKLDTIIEPYRFLNEDWLSRPAWFWNDLSNNEAIKEVKDPWSVQWPNHVFCEDVSRFLPRQDAQEFVSDLTSAYVRRFALRLPDIQYRSISRFSL